MKKHEIIDYAHKNYPKGTKFKWYPNQILISSGKFNFPYNDCNALYVGDYPLFDGIDWATIVTEEKPKELEIGRWYRHKHYANNLAFKTNKNGGYGFWGGCWREEVFCDAIENWILATEDEVFEALKNEAIKRGYDGKHIKIMPYLERKGDKSYDRLENKFTFNIYTNKLSSIGKGTYTIFKDGVWAEIIEEPKSILDGKVAIQVNNEREFKLLMEHFKSKGWSTNNYRYFECNKFAEYRDDFYFMTTELYVTDNGYTIIPFDTFAKEVGIEVPIWLGKSEDLVDLYVGDEYYHVWYNHDNKWELLRNAPYPLNYDGYLASVEDKVFSSKEKALEWCSEQNKPKELEVGKWYRYNNWLVCYTGIEGGLFKGYAFNAQSSWHGTGNFGSEKNFRIENWTLATEQEVFEALKNEAVKRGFKEGVEVTQINTLNCGDISGKPFVLNNKEFLMSAGMLFKDNVCLFKDGKWAEIIEEVKFIHLDISNSTTSVTVKKDRVDGLDNLIGMSKIDVQNILQAMNKLK